MRPQLSRLQQSIAAPDTEDSPQSFSYPTSAISGPPDYGRKTWSAPNKDPFGGGGGGGLEDPFQRRSGQGAGRKVMCIPHLTAENAEKTIVFVGHF